ncbi:MAG: alkaline phosphatase family protein [Candidatus Rokuibacteriota bacterium]
MTSRIRVAAALVLSLVLLLATSALAAPRVIVISLDGATPRLLNQYLDTGALGHSEGVGLLRRAGLRARQNVTISPSLTAAAHIAIATGSHAAHNDVVANTFHLVASPFTTNISGFAAPVGGYSIDGPAESPAVTADLVWNGFRRAGKTVVTATFPGADGLDIRVPGVPTSPIVQPAAERTVDFTVPFGAFAGQGARGFSLAAADFGPAGATTIAQLEQAGVSVFAPVLEKTSPLESFTLGGVTYEIRVAALDTTNDAQVNYDTLVFFDTTNGIKSGPFALPSTGPAYVRASAKRSALFYLEGSSSKAGVGFYVSRLAGDLSTVRISRTSANAIPRNAAVLADVDDINTHVGFWAPQPDFRIPERLSPGYDPFPDLELEEIYADLVRSFTDYQARVALRAISRVPDADLVMIYFEQPDGSSHQFLITDPRQPTDFKNPASIGAGQDKAKVTRYASYVRTAYQVANRAVQRIIDAVGIDGRGRPRSNIIVVSDHGFEIFHTAVNMTAFLTSKGFDPGKVRAVTSGPAVNVYINLQGREPNGVVSRAEYVSLQAQVVEALESLADTNPNYTLGKAGVPVFDKVYARPLPAELDDPSFGRSTSAFIGQDGGDVFALLAPGYNFDGVQNPVVQRLGDPSATTPIVSLPNFYGAHGYDPTIENLSAIFFAAGPDIRHGELTLARNIDVVPTIARLLGLKPAATVDGTALPVRAPHRVQVSLLERLAGLLPTGDKKADRAIEKAIGHLRAGLSDRFWIDSAHLNARGEQVYQEARQAVAALPGLENLSAVTADIRGEIVTIGEELAAILIDEVLGAVRNPDRLDRAREAMTAGTALSEGQPGRALDHYRRA